MISCECCGSLGDQSLCPQCSEAASLIDELTEAQRRHVLARALVRSTRDRLIMLGCTARQHESQINNACYRVGLKRDVLTRVAAWGLSTGRFARPQGFEDRTPINHVPGPEMDTAVRTRPVEIDAAGPEIETESAETPVVTLAEVAATGVPMSEPLDAEIALAMEAAVDEMFESEGGSGMDEDVDDAVRADQGGTHLIEDAEAICRRRESELAAECGAILVDLLLRRSIGMDQLVSAIDAARAYGVASGTLETIREILARKP